uniref:Uncharacterized protein n=1 Tax=Anguilla anguilla TaxID=7936 RepID=A0A0E9UMT1_ANGAN
MFRVKNSLFCVTVKLFLTSVLEIWHWTHGQSES